MPTYMIIDRAQGSVLDFFLPHFALAETVNHSFAPVAGRQPVLFFSFSFITNSAILLCFSTCFVSTSFKMVLGFGSIKSGPILEYPLVEHNSDRQVRPVYINIRKVKGKRGWLLRRLGHFIAPDPTPEGLGHHAIQVGSYAYELHTDEANQKYLLVQRLTDDQIWSPTVRRGIVGYCNFTDDEVAMHGKSCD